MQRYTKRSRHPSRQTSALRDKEKRIVGPRNLERNPFQRSWENRRIAFHIGTRPVAIMHRKNVETHPLQEVFDIFKSWGEDESSQDIFKEEEQ